MNTFSFPRLASIPLRRQRGAGALLAVVLLYAAMAIIVVFTNRNLVFEQKTSANQARATIAQEAAEAGLEWATAMLNRAGGITTTDLGNPSNKCTAGTSADLSYRERYLAYDLTTKLWSVNGGSGTVHAACVASQTGTGWNCHCPTVGTALSPTAPAGAGFKPAFAVAFVSNAATNTVDLVSYGCTSAITSATCTGDASATVRVSMGQLSAMATTPGAPLTARGAVSVGNAALGVQNGDPTTAGITVNAGMGIDATNLRITSTPGTPPTSTLVGNDASLRNSTEDQMFQTFFGVPKATYKNSVADVVLTCPCTESDLQTAYNNKNRAIWLNGDLTMNSNVTIGSDTDPFVLIVDGAAHMNGNIRLFGVVYSTAIEWNNTGGGGALVQGAVISEGSYTGNGTPDYYYDPRVMNRLVAIPGAFIRIPGSWRDF